MGEFARRIRAARGYADISQQELADRMGVDVQWVKRREKSAGGQNPKPGELIAIAAICEVPIDFMLDGFSERTPSEIAERLARIEELLSPSGEALERELADAADEADTRTPGSEQAGPEDRAQGRGL